MMDTVTITGLRFQLDSSSGKHKMVRRKTGTPTPLLCIPKFLIPKFPINRCCIPRLSQMHSGMLHRAWVLLPLPWQCLTSCPGLEGAIAVGNDSTSLSLLILDFFPLHPPDPDGPGVEPVAGQHQGPVSHFFVHMDVKGSGNWIMKKSTREILMGMGQW